MNNPKYYLESLLRGTKMGSAYSIDMCETDLKEFYLKPKKVDQVYENEVDYLLHIICEAFEVTKVDVLSKSRKRDLVSVRQMFCKLVVNDFHCLTLKGCGRFIGGRDHSTVIHSIRHFDNIIETESTISDKYLDIKSRFDKYLKGGIDV